MKRWYYVLVALCLCMGFVGCGKKQTISSPKEKEPAKIIHNEELKEEESIAVQGETEKSTEKQTKPNTVNRVQEEEKTDDSQMDVLSSDEGEEPKGTVTLPKKPEKPKELTLKPEKEEEFKEELEKPKEPTMKSEKEDVKKETNTSLEEPEEELSGDSKVDISIFEEEEEPKEAPEKPKEPTLELEKEELEEDPITLPEEPEEKPKLDEDGYYNQVIRP